MKTYRLRLGKEYLPVSPEQTGFLFDIQDTLLRTRVRRGEEIRELLPGALELVSDLIAHGFRLKLVTNLSTGSTSSLLGPFREAGLPLSREHIITTADVAGRLLKENGFETVHVIGRGKLRTYFKKRGFHIANPSTNEEVEAREREGVTSPVVIGFPFPFSIMYEQLPGVIHAIALGAPIYLLDYKVSIFLAGTLWPGELSIASFLMKAAGREDTEVIVTGKPSKEFFREAKRAVAPKRGGDVLVIGDSPQTDLSPPRSLRITPVGVLTGSPNNSEILVRESKKPKGERSVPYIVKSVKEIRLLV